MAKLGRKPKAILTATHKSCNLCHELKPHHGFNRQAAGYGGLHNWCKTCLYEYRREWVSKNRDRVRARYRGDDLKKSFGITVEQYDAMLAAQGGVCAICGNVCKSGRRLAVDHNHESGLIRGLLCSGCNHGMGFLGDDAERLRAAARYLDEREGVSHPHRVHVAA